MFVVFVTFAGVTVTVSEQLPAFSPLIVVEVAEQILFDAVATTTEVFEPFTTVVPAVVSADTTVSVLPFTTVGVFTTTGVTVVGVGVAVVPPDDEPLDVELPPEFTRAVNAPPPVPAARLRLEAHARTAAARTPAAVTLSVADFGTSRSLTAPVLRPVFELLTSLIASAAGVTAVVGVVGPVPVAAMAAPVVPSTAKLVSTALMSPLPDATPMSTSPDVASA